MKATIPEAFEQLMWGGFYQGSLDDYPNVDAWIKGTVAAFGSTQDRRILTDFLDDLLGGKYSNDEIREIYMSVGPTWVSSNGLGTRMFLEKIRAELG